MTETEIAPNSPNPSDWLGGGWPIWRAVALAVASGALLGAIFLLPSIAVLTCIALVPLLLALRENSNSWNFLMGWIAGLLWFLIACHWLRHVTWPGLIALGLLQGTYLGAWMLFAGRYSPRWRLFYFPMIWVTLEFVRSKGPLGFSWNLIGHTMEPLLFLAQGWGVYGISFLVVAVNAFVAWAILAAMRRPPMERMPEGAGFLLLLPVIWLGIAWSEIEPVPDSDRLVEVGIVQGSFPQSLKWQVPLNEAVTRYVDLTQQLLESDDPALVVWPEVAVPTVLTEEPDLFRYLRDRTQEWGVALLFGVLDQDNRNVETPRLTNSAVLVDAARYNHNLVFQNAKEMSDFMRGEKTAPSRSLLIPNAEAQTLPRPVWVYDKARLLPFGEYVPFRSLIPFVQEFVEKRGGGAFSQGEPGKVLMTRIGEIGPLICFESTHPGLARRAVLNGAEMLVNMTNDAWFLQTAASRQHAVQSRFRAVETGRAVVRAANTGLSTVFLPNGSMIASLPEWKPGATTALVPMHSHLTFQARVGDFLGWLCIGCLLLSALLSPVRDADNEEC